MQATDAATNTGSRSYTVNIGSNILTLAPASLPNGTQGTAYSQTVTASGGTAPYTFAVSSGSLPTGSHAQHWRRHQRHADAAAAHLASPSGAPIASAIPARHAYTINIGINSLT